MLRLDLKKAPRWLEIAPGVRIELMPPTMKLIMAARRDPEVLALVEGLEGDPALLEGREDLAMALAQAVARRAIIGWEGVLDDHDRLAPVTPEHIDALMEHPSAFEAFQRDYLAPAMMLASEKNDSALSPTGTSAGVTNTARRARRAAKSAPTKKTSRAASKAR